MEENIHKKLEKLAYDITAEPFFNRTIKTLQTFKDQVEKEQIQKLLNDLIIIKNNIDTKIKEWEKLLKNKEA